MNRPGPVEVRSEDPVEQPIARVVIDSPLPHLDRPFDYAVPASMAGAAAVGARVKVRFAGQDLDAYVLERRDDTDHEGRLLPLRRVVSAEPVLTGQVARLARAVADRYVGTLSDVLRLAVPPRHATTEKRERTPGAAPERSGGDADPSAAHSDGTHSDGTHSDGAEHGLGRQALARSLVGLSRRGRLHRPSGSR